MLLYRGETVVSNLSVFRKDTELNKALGTGSIDRSARVRRIKRVILGLIVLAIVLPTVLCILLFIKLHKLEGQLLELSYEKETVNVVLEETLEAKASEPVAHELTTKTLYSEEAVLEETEEENAEEASEEIVVDEADSEEGVMDESIVEDAEPVEESSEVADEDNDSVKLKRVYLTFDDGPSSNTIKILDILKEKDVTATFFVVGRLSDTTTPIYKRIVDEGHTLGMHSYTHVYKEIYSSEDAFEYDLDRIQALIYEQTGVLSKYYRFPGGSSNRVSKVPVENLKKILDERGIKYYDWNVVSGDASSRYGLPKSEIVKKCINGAAGQEEAMILMHDLPEKATTVEALPEIIDYFKSIGAEIVAIDDDSAQFAHTVELNY